MVFMRDSDRAAASVPAAGLEIGLHMNFSLPFTAKEVPQKLREQQERLALYLTKSRVSGAILNPLLTDSFEFVFSSQKKEFFRLYSRLPDFYNGHHHVHLCANMLARHLIPRGARVRQTFTCEPRKGGLIRRFYRRALSRYIAKRFVSTDSFFGIEPIRDQKRLGHIIGRAAHEDVEIEVHPENDIEMEYLLSERFQSLIGSIQLGGFLHLPLKPQQE